LTDQLMPAVDEIWARISAHEGEDFETITGKIFQYEIHGDLFYPSRAKQHLPKSEFANVIAVAPLDGPGQISQEVRGSAYAWAVLHDKRIRQEDW